VYRTLHHFSTYLKNPDSVSDAFGVVDRLFCVGLLCHSFSQSAGCCAGALGGAGLPEVDAIVLLGGGIVNPASPRLEPELDAHGDRLGYAARLYKAGKAPVIVVSGGNVFDEPGMLSNAEYSAQLLERWGVPRSDMVLESDSRNTYENARETARLLPATQTTILLVTSAFHMRRAIPLFEAQGFSVVHASTDIQFTSFSGPGIIKWLPEVYHLDLTTKAIKEFIG